MNCRTQFRHLGMLDIDTFTKVSERLEFLLYSEFICRLLLFSDGSCTFCNRNWLPTHLYGTYPLWSCGQRACQMLTHPSCLFTLWDICDGLLLGNSHEGRISILLRSEPSSPSWPSNYCGSIASCYRPAPTSSFSRFSRLQCWAVLRWVADGIATTSSDKDLLIFIVTEINICHSWWSLLQRGYSPIQRLYAAMIDDRVFWKDLSR
jgi:hypothetical protein